MSAGKWHRIQNNIRRSDLIFKWKFINILGKQYFFLLLPHTEYIENPL